MAAPLMPERDPFEREVHDRLVNLESSLSSILQQFPQLLERQTDMVGRLVRIEERLAAREDSTNTRLEAHSLKLSDHEERIRTLEGTAKSGVMMERVFWIFLTALCTAGAAWVVSG
jgi:predicted  nucleic acid-binding Zn-ribbon protein